MDEPHVFQVPVGTYSSLYTHGEETTLTCPQCNSCLFRVKHTFFNQGMTWPGLLCIPEQALWQDPKSHWGCFPCHPHLVKEFDKQINNESK
jgi:hypothetical protein